MPQIPQISGPLAGGKGLNPQTGGATNQQSGTLFQVDGVDQIQKVADVSQKPDGMGSAGFNPATGAGAGAISAPAAKDPSMAVETMHDVLGAELLESVKQQGYTELEGELQDLTQSLYLKPSQLMREILTQEKDNTAFSGTPLFDCLRTLAGTGDDDTRELVANLLKGINYAMNRQEIVRAVTANIKFLSEYFGENTTIAKNFAALYQKWAKVDLSDNPQARQGFEMLKGETTEMLRLASDSLQNDQRTQTLIPLIVHNLSRYNTNKYMMKEAFSQLLAQVPSNSLREQLIDSFGQFMRTLSAAENSSSLNNTTFNKINQEPLEIFSENGEKINLNTFLKLKMADPAYLSKLNLSPAAADIPVRTMLQGKTDGAGAIKALLSMLFPKNQQDLDLNMANARKTLYNQIDSADNLRDLAKMLNGVIKNLPQNETRQQILDSLGKIISQMNKNQELPANPGSGKAGSEPLRAGQETFEIFSENGEKIDLNTFLQRKMADPAYLSKLDHSPQNADAAVKAMLQGKTDGAGAIKTVLSMLFPKNEQELDLNMANARKTLYNQIDNADNLRDLAKMLNGVIKNLPQNEMRQQILDSLGKIISQMNKNQELPANPGSGKGRELSRAGSGSLEIFSENGEKIDFNTFLQRKMADPAYLSKLDLSPHNADAPIRAMLLGKTEGVDTIKAVLSMLFPKNEEELDLNMANARQTLYNQVDDADNLRDLVEMLNGVLTHLPQSGARQEIADSLAEIISQMAKNGELPTEKQAAYEEKQVSDTMKALTGFIQRNVNHPAIKSVDNFNASNLLQSLLNAPGVFTPLSHYIIPLQIDHTRAFGELWVDSEGKKSSRGDGTRQQHVFLTFDVEAIGRFEANLYLEGKSLNVSLLHPASYTEKSEALTEKISKIAAGLGLSTENFRTGILTQPHTLAEVFPKILENRRSFDVKA